MTDNLGDPVADGNYQMRFIIYNAATGGTDLWHETHMSVMLTNGIYNVILGQIEPLDPGDFDGDLYLGVTVSGDSEMTPRQKLTSTSFAMKAAIADDADTLDGLDSGDFAETGHEHDAADISSGTFSDARIPGGITRDTELDSGLSTKANLAHNHSAADIASGTLSTSRFSARGDLSAEGYLGNASGDIAQNNGTLQTNLNADLLDGQQRQKS